MIPPEILDPGKKIYLDPVTCELVTDNGRWQYQYCHLADYHTGNLSKCHNVITGTVTWPITIQVMIQSVTMALPVQ